MVKFRLLIIAVFGVLTFCTLEGQGYSLYRICQSNDTVKLNFNPLKDTCSDFLRYEIYWQKDPNKPFQAIDTLTDASKKSFLHNPDNLNNLENWRYFIKAKTACPDGTTDTDTIKVDKERPVSLKLDSVTVKDGDVQLGWSKHPDSAIKGYIMYFVEGGQTVKIDQVLGHKNLNYTENSESNPESTSEGFRIAAFDSCGNESPLSENVHKTILLQEPTIDTCERTVDLSWSAYEGWPVDSYAIVASPEQGENVVAKKVDGNTLNTTVSSLQGGKNYEVKVRAEKANEPDVTSSSNAINVQLGSTGDLGYAYLKAATVVDSQIRLKFEVDNKANLRSITLLKGLNANELSPFRTINPVEKTAYSVIDSIANPQAESKVYKIRANGLCEGKTVESNTARNINLRLKTVEDSIRLRWSEYETFNGGVENYLVQRQTQLGDLANWETVATLEPEKLNYQKLNDFKDSDEPRACFRIKAVEGPNNEFGFQENSVSNVVCLLSDPVVYIPDAIVIDGVNNVFRPQGRFINLEASSMAIYNRWGEEVYQTDDLKIGWDGSKDGEKVPQGEYLYKLTIVGVNQSISTIKGTLTVIR